MSQTFQTMSMPKADYSTWLTKQQAADVLNVTPKTVERMAADRKIEQAIWKRPRKPAIAVFHPEDVQRIWKERHPDNAEAFVIPPDATANALDKTPVPHAAAPNAELPRMEGFMRLLLEGQKAQESGISELRYKLFLTVREASVYSGLPQSYLQKLIESGELATITLNNGSKRIRRIDLERL